MGAMINRAAWTPAMRSLLVGHDVTTLGVHRDDAQHWPGLECLPLWVLIARCGRQGWRMRLTTDRAQVSCGACLELLVQEESL